MKCANVAGCQNEFEPRTKSNIYCSAECRSTVTNEANKRKYHREVARRKGKLERICLICNITKLSRYNKKDICEPCQEQENENARKKLLKELGL